MMQVFHLTHYIWSLENSIDDDQSIIISIRCFGAIFEIRYLPENIAASSHLLRQHDGSLGILRAEDQGGRYAQEAEEQIRILKKPFEKLMEDVAPKQASITSLFDYLYPLYLVLEARAATQNSTTIQPYFKGSVPRQILGTPGQYLSAREDWLQLIKSFTSRQIQLIPTSPDLKDHPCLCGPSKVVAGDGTICMFKTPGKLWLYKQIAFAFKNKSLRSDIRISRLHNVVIDKDSDVLQHYIDVPLEEFTKWNGISGSDLPADIDHSCLKRLVGILLVYIENQGTLYDIAPFSDCTDEQRHCWVAEIEDLVEELHAAGLVWGDAKPHNVLVDRKNRLWLIDFDGSYTSGWVDAAKKETQEGDLQGLKRIKEWLIECCKKPIDRIVPQNT